MRRTTAAAIRLDAPTEILANWIALRMPYMVARIQLVVKRRTKASNLEDVGQIRRRKGTSTKMRTNDEALYGLDL
jgi:hypothetical protein